MVRDINQTLSGGEIIVLIGPNGTGKSTLLKRTSGLLPTGGRMYFESQESMLQDVSSAYMPQDTLTYSSLTVLEVILLGKLRTL